MNYVDNKSKNMENLILNQIYSNKQISPKYIKIIFEYLKKIKYSFSYLSNGSQFIIFSSSNSSILKPIVLNILNCDITLHRLKYQSDIQFYYLTKILCQIFILYYDVFTNNHIYSKFTVQYWKNLVQYNNLNDVIYRSVQFQDSKICHILYLYWCYFALFNDYRFLKSLDARILKQFKNFEKKIQTINTNWNGKNFCKICLNFSENIETLKLENLNISKKYNISQSEKEKLVMKYATSEKSLIETRRLLKVTEKKYSDIHKENLVLQKGIQKVQNDVIKFSQEINCKNIELAELQNELQYFRSKNKDKHTMWTQKKLASNPNSIKEKEIKLIRSMTPSSEIYYQYSPELKIDHKTKNINKLNNINEKTSSINIENTITSDTENTFSKLEPASLITFQTHINKVDNLHSLYISNLQRELENEKRTIQSLNKRISEYESLMIRSKSNEQRMFVMDMELNRLSIEKTEFQEDIEFFRKRENQMLEFIQKLTSKNIQLQCELTNMKSKLCSLENSHMTLHESISNFMNEIKNLECHISSENIKRIQECQLLTKCIAEQTFYNEKLLLHLEDVVGDNNILRKRHTLTVREMTKELRDYHTNINFRVTTSLTEKDSYDFS